MYRLILTNSRSPRDGKYIEILGWYNPLESELEKMLHVQADRVQYWLDQGAIVTEKVEALIKKSAPAVVEAYRKKKLDHVTKERLKRRAAVSKAAKTETVAKPAKTAEKKAPAVKKAPAAKKEKAAAS